VSPFRLSWRLLWRGAAIWSGILGVIVMIGVRAYNELYPTEAARQLAVTEFSNIRALSALYGRPVGLDTPGGFIVWRYGAFAGVVAGLWGLMAVSRVLRGDEEVGRTELVLSGDVGATRLLLTQLGAFGLGVAVIAAGTLLGCLASGLRLGGSALFSISIAGDALVFGMIAALTSQLFDARRRAAGWAGATLGVAYLLRALGDGAPERSWVSWLSPIGWTGRISAFTDPSLAPIALIASVTAVLLGGCVVLMHRRDIGAGLIGARTRAGVHLRRVRSPLALDWLLARGAAIAWAVGVIVYGYVLGFLAADMIDYLRNDKNLLDMFSRIGGNSIVTVKGFLGLTFTIVGIVLAVYAGSMVSAARTEEAEGRVEGLVTSGVGRGRWLGARVLVGGGGVVALALVGAFGAWVGTVSNGSSVGLGETLLGGLNAVPVALVFGGLSLLAFGLLPRTTAFVAYGAVAVAYVIQMIGALAGAPSWVTDLSPFAHVAAVPAVPVNVTATVVMLAVAAALGLGGLIAFRRRDITAE